MNRLPLVRRVGVSGKKRAQGLDGILSLSDRWRLADAARKVEFKLLQT